jgi:16S rRNA (uracil1498-N3)-methyltransferase
MLKEVTNFYVLPEDVEADSLVIRGEEAHHLLKACRGRPGEVICASDGLGKKYVAVIREIEPDRARCEIAQISRNENEPVVKITLAQGLPQGLKMDYIIEKTTELGVHTIQPVHCKNSLSERSNLAVLTRKQKRWQRLAIAAFKQSLRTHLPVVELPIEFEDLLDRAIDFDLTLIAAPDKGSISVHAAIKKRPGPSRVLLLVGPEAGFTDEERETAISSGFVRVSLGPRRLRTETAAQIVSALVLYELGELQ